MHYEPVKYSGMIWRRRVFWLLAFLSLLFICGGAGFAGELFNETMAQSEYEAGTMQAEAYETGAVLGATGVMGVTTCIGLIFFGFFALMGWRNGVGIREAQRHNQQIEAITRQQSL